MIRPRILHVGKYYSPIRGGIESVVETLCRGEKALVDTRALVLNTAFRTERDVLDGVAVTRVGCLTKIGAVSVAPTLPVWLARSKADLLVLHEPNPMALAAYYLVRPRSPLVVWYHSEVIRPAWQYRLCYAPLLEFALRRAARIVVASPPMLDVPALAAHRAKCVVIPYGLDVQRYEPTARVSSAADSVRKKAGVPIFLFVGRLVGYKGLDVLLRALPGLEARVIVVGDGPRRSSLQALASELEVSDRVRFVGQVGDEELLAWYHACDALVLPSVSRQEAFGMVQLEAMLCGRPIVSTDLDTGVSWVNEHERTGLVVPPRDVGALHNALARLVSDPALGQRLGTEARARVLARFTSDAMCGATFSLYREVWGTAASAVRRDPVRAS